MHININHKKVIAILDTGTPDNIVSTKLMNTIKLAPDVNYSQSFGMAGLNVTQAVGAYSALTLRFGKVIVQSTAIVLNTNNYDILIGTGFIKIKIAWLTWVKTIVVLTEKKFQFFILERFH